MRLLIIEDDSDFLDVMKDGLASRGLSIELHVAISRDGALALLEQRHYDVVVCDLVIPTLDHGLDAHREHGLAVFRRVRHELTGAPIVIFSAWSTKEVLESEVLPATYADDPFALGTKEAMIHAIDKQELGKWLDMVERCSVECDAVDAIGIQDHSGLNEREERLVRLIARQHGAVSVAVDPLSGGLSSARTVQLEGVDASDGVCLRVVFKIATLSDLAQEVGRYERYVPSMLAPGAYAPLASQVTAGASGYGGAAYSLADRHESLFDLTERDSSLATKAVEELQVLLAPWQMGSHPLDVTIREICDRFAGELTQDVRDSLPASFPEVEARVIRIQQATQHGDMHGLNVLVDAAGDPLIIDFAATSPGPSSSDAIQLELSYVFHPLAPKALGSPSDLRLWVDIDDYAERSPYPDVTRACREWAGEVAASDVEIAAVALGWGIRQLKYAESREAATELIRAALDALA